MASPRVFGSVNVLPIVHFFGAQNGVPWGKIRSAEWPRHVSGPVARPFKATGQAETIRCQHTSSAVSLVFWLYWRDIWGCGGPTEGSKHDAVQMLNSWSQIQLWWREQPPSRAAPHFFHPIPLSGWWFLFNSIFPKFRIIVFKSMYHVQIYL